jgi:hypothetical protein
MDYEFIFERFREAIARKCTCLDDHGWRRLTPFKGTGSACKCLDFVTASVFTRVKSHRTDLALSETEEIE